MATARRPAQKLPKLGHTELRDLKGLVEFCTEQRIPQGYLITRDFADFKVVEAGATQVLKLPAPLACYWLGRAELQVT